MTNDWPIGRFRTEADMDRQARPAKLVESNPSRSSATIFRCAAPAQLFRFRERQRGGLCRIAGSSAPQIRSATWAILKPQDGVRHIRDHSSIHTGLLSRSLHYVLA
jgi:hypothetical protein